MALVAGSTCIRFCLSHIPSLCSLHPFLLSYFSQQQSGLISRVTDTVKSIVPSWLQKYFKNQDAPEGGGAVLGTDQNCQLPPPPPNGSEEGPPPLDGRDSPEPSTSNTGERVRLLGHQKRKEKKLRNFLSLA